MREFFKAIGGDIRNWLVGLVLGGIVLVAYPLVAAIVKAIKSESIPWTIFGIITLIGAGQGATTLWEANRLTDDITW